MNAEQINTENVLDLYEDAIAERDRLAKESERERSRAEFAEQGRNAAGSELGRKCIQLADLRRELRDIAGIDWDNADDDTILMHLRAMKLENADERQAAAEYWRKRAEKAEADTARLRPTIVELRAEVQRLRESHDATTAELGAAEKRASAWWETAKTLLRRNIANHEYYSDREISLRDQIAVLHTARGENGGQQ